jgi:hypothetical protein
MEPITILAIVLLALHWKGPNAVWGGATLGVIVGLIVALVVGDWSLLALIFAIGTFAGTIFEWIGRLTERLGRVTVRRNKSMKQIKRNLFSRKKSEDEPVIEGKYFAKYKDLLDQEIIMRLKEEYISQKVIFEPIRDQLTREEQDELYMQIDKSDVLSSQEKLETVIGLMMVLDGSFPEPKILSSMKKVFSKEFVEAIEEKKNDFKGEIAVKKLIRFVKEKYKK